MQTITEGELHRRRRTDRIVSLLDFWWVAILYSCFKLPDLKYGKCDSFIALCYEKRKLLHVFYVINTHNLNLALVHYSINIHLVKML